MCSYSFWHSLEPINSQGWPQAGSVLAKRFKRQLEKQQDRPAQQHVRITTRSPAAAGPLAGTSSFPVRRQGKIRMGEVVMDVVSPVRWYVRKTTRRLLLINHPQ